MVEVIFIKEKRDRITATPSLEYPSFDIRNVKIVYY